jgi:putative tryptophan/tyrosine transport system substrate-binding protein
MQRREFITLIGGAATAPMLWPRAARAQQPAMPVIGFLNSRSRQSFMSTEAVFLKTLNEAGYVEGRNIAIEYRYADGAYDRLPALAADLVRRQVAVIVAGGGELAALAAKAATSTIPIVFTIGSDPVKAGLVMSYNRPGGNITGINILTEGLDAKRLGLLHTLLPQATTIGFLTNPRFASADSQLQDVQEAARTLGLKIHTLPASTEAEIDAVFETIAREQISAVEVGADPFLDNHRNKLVTLAARYSVATMYHFREQAVAGGLISYGIDIIDVFRQVGLYVVRILKGEKPADLPVMQPTKFELVFNLKTAKVLGLAIPPTLLALADEVIE